MEIEGLIKEHKKEIQKILSTLDTSVNILTPIDELFVLRFILSGQTKHIQKCIDYRLKHVKQLEKVLKDKTCDGADRIEPFVQADYIGVIMKSPAFMVNVGKCDLHKVMHSVTKQKLEEILLYSEEFGFQLVDRITRDTGKLTKILFIANLNGLSRKQVNFSFLKVLGNVSHKSSIYYPQLIKQKIFIKVPYIVKSCIKIFNSFHHPKSVQKHAFCLGKYNGNHLDFEKCPYLKNAKDRDKILLSVNFENLQTSIIKNVTLDDLSMGH